MLLDQYAVELDLDDAYLVTRPSPSPPSISPTIRKLAFDAVGMSMETLTKQTELRQWEEWQCLSSKEAQRLSTLYQGELANSKKLNAQLSCSQNDMTTLQARHLICLRQVEQLRDCVSTLHAAHMLDASINSLLIEDQEREISELKSRLADADRHRQLLRKLLDRVAPKAVLQRQSEMTEKNVNRPNSGRRLRAREQGNTPAVTGAASSANVMSGLCRRVSSLSLVKGKKLAQLQKSKQDLLDAFQKRNSSLLHSRKVSPGSTTLDNAVFSISPMSIALAASYSESPGCSTD